MLQHGIAAIAALLLTSCAAATANWAQQRSVGHVPCPPDEIEVVETRHGGGQWTARCRDVTYYCSWAGNGIGVGRAGNVSCVDAGAPEGAGRAASALQQ